MSIKIFIFLRFNFLETDQVANVTKKTEDGNKTETICK